MGNIEMIRCRAKDRYGYKGVWILRVVVEEVVSLVYLLVSLFVRVF